MRRVGAGHGSRDPLILDDQALVINVASKGLVLGLTGCGSRGAVHQHRLLHPAESQGADAVYAVIGSFHLDGQFLEPRIAATCEALATLAPEVILPAHCTGWRATHALAAR